MLAMGGTVYWAVGLPENEARLEVNKNEDCTCLAPLASVTFDTLTVEMIGAVVVLVVGMAVAELEACESLESL